MIEIFLLGVVVTVGTFVPLLLELPEKLIEPVFGPVFAGLVQMILAIMLLAGCCLWAVPVILGAIL